MPTDFGYDNGISPAQEPINENNQPNNPDNSLSSIDGDNMQYDANGNPITPIDNANNDNGEGNKVVEDNDEQLEAGTEIQLGDITYTVDDKGNVIDAQGNIFKEAKDVKAWMAEFEQEEQSAEDEVNVQNLQKALEIVVTDENDNEIEYPNTVQGMKDYVEQVIESAREEHYETAINALFNKYPFVQDMINYYNANGNSLQGYGEVPDRSGVTIDETNEAQQEYIIRTAWQEQKKKGVDGYIQYLKSTGNLLTVAKEELENLKESDRAYREEIKAKADAAEKQREEESKAFWNNVYEVVKSRNIAGYNIPESIVVERNGKKMTATINDFFNYIYQTDDTGRSRYDYDRESEDVNSKLNDFILKAYLKFTGGSYSNLVDMAINKKEVNKLILKSKENKKPSMGIRKPAPKQNNKIDLGYN